MASRRPPYNRPVSFSDDSPVRGGLLPREPRASPSSFARWSSRGSTGCRRISRTGSARERGERYDLVAIVGPIRIPCGPGCRTWATLTPTSSARRSCRTTSRPPKWDCGCLRVRWPSSATSRVEGTEQLTEEVVTRMLPFSQGSMYRREDVLTAQRNLYNLENRALGPRWTSISRISPTR